VITNWYCRFFRYLPKKKFRAKGIPGICTSLL
jgi:hypothetical protein